MRNEQDSSDFLRKTFDPLTTGVENGSEERGEHDMNGEERARRGGLGRLGRREASHGRKVPIPRVRAHLTLFSWPQHAFSI